jgi:hypothetical protein
MMGDLVTSPDDNRDLVIGLDDGIEWLQSLQQYSTTFNNIQQHSTTFNNLHPPRRPAQKESHNFQQVIGEVEKNRF